ncbi:MAG: hypothetical protein J6X61_02260 [Clostridia bacterium]|nr:hypothetical protein [Clostridia bacterium]
MNKKTSLLPMIPGLLGGLLMAVTVFLPYLTGSYDSFSLVQYIDVYKDYLGDAAGTVFTILIVLTCLFALLTALFGGLRKAIPTIIFDVLAFVPFVILRADFGARGFPDSRYSLGVGYWLFYVGVALALSGAVWMFVCKAQAKKAAALPAESAETAETV